MNEENTSAVEVLEHYGIVNAALCPVSSGLINRSWQVTHNADRYLLQHVNDMFDAEIHGDIASVTEALAGSGLTTPRLVPTLDDQLCYRHDSGTWRLYTFVTGVSIERVSEAGQAHEAGRILSQFHRVLAGLDITFGNRRPNVHDTRRHLLHLKQTLEHRQDHPRYGDIRSLATEILDTGTRLPPLETMPRRKVHGDPKINNVLFEPGSGKGLCMVDFDTMVNMSLPLELGDAMRSWCNPAGEDNREGRFEPVFFRAGLEAYRLEAAELVTDAEIRSVLPATASIYIELASRFCADALNEDYFSWDPQCFDSHSHHSETRAISQLNCYKSLSRQIPGLETMVDDLLGH